MTKSKKIKDSKATKSANGQNTLNKNSVANEKTKANESRDTTGILENFSKKANELKAEISDTLERQANLDILKQNDQRNSDQIVQLEKTLEEFSVENVSDKDQIETPLTDNNKKNINGSVNDSTRVESPIDQTEINGQPSKDKTTKVVEVPKQELAITASSQTQSNALFEPLEAQLDPDSKCTLLMASMKRHITEQKSNNDDDNNNNNDSAVSISRQLIGSLLEPLCRKLVELGDSRESFRGELELERSRRLKLERLCRELQKSNNAIRIESLGLIHAEQKRAKDQGSKIQETLAGVMNLFNKNQERNVAICKENRDLQTKLVNLLEHCGNWEKSVETALKEKELTIKLAKTQVAKCELLRHEEKESWLEQKKDYLKIINLLQQKQTVMEAQSEKLKKELDVNMEKYEVFHKQVGEKTNKFQKESKVLFDRMEKSSKEHKIMVESYEKLLNENRKWLKANELSAKKIEALEKLCRTLRNKQPPASSVDKEQQTTPNQLHRGQHPTTTTSTKPSEVTSSINIATQQQQRVEQKSV